MPGDPHRKDRERHHKQHSSKKHCKPCSEPCPPNPCPPNPCPPKPCPPKPCPGPCPPCPEQKCPSFDESAPCPTPACPQPCPPCPPKPCYGQPCPPKPCPPAPPCPPPCPDQPCRPRRRNWSLIPKGLWCDTLSCVIPCDRVYNVTDKLQVRVNLYCSPFENVVTANSVPVLGALQLPPFCFNNIINNIANTACAWSCPVKNIVEEVDERTDLTTLASAIAASPEVDQYLRDHCTTATLFAPTNKAFEDAAESLGFATVEELVAYLINTEYSPGTNLLTALLLNHTLPKVVFSAAYKRNQSTKVQNKLQECLQVFKFDQYPNDLCVTTQSSEKAKVLEKDILATNGTIFVVNKVLTI